MISMFEQPTCHIYSSEELAVMLKKHGIRPSVQRIAVLGKVANSKEHPSADEIYVGLAEAFPSLSRTTVYNSLHAFAGCGLLRQLEIESDCLRYDLAARQPHSHFMCRKCGRIIDMPMPSGMEPTEVPGFSIDSVDVYFKGLCPECRKQ